MMKYSDFVCLERLKEFVAGHHQDHDLTRPGKSISKTGLELLVIQTQTAVCDDQHAHGRCHRSDN